jgi:starch synthase (maltosyl-transferring)
VITELDVGGAEQALAMLAGGLDRNRWRPTVIALGPEAAMAPVIRASGVDVICLGVDRKRPLRAVARLASLLRTQRPALVQSFLFHANVAVRLAAPLLRSPRPWILGGLRVAEREKSWHVALEMRTASLGSGAVCVSEGVRRFTRAAGWPDDRLTVIPNSVDPRRFDAVTAAPRASLGIPDGAFLALHVGRFAAQKNLPMLLAVAERVFTSEPRRDWHLALVGDGPERAGIGEQIARSRTLADRVHLLGRREDIPALVKTADLLVSTSLWEGMPNVILEAMAARRAVAATAIEGTEDLVVPGETGWLVPPRDDAALAAAWLDAASDPERLARFGEAGRNRVEAEFSPARIVRAYEHLWAQLIGYEDPDPPTESMI